MGLVRTGKRYAFCCMDASLFYTFWHFHPYIPANVLDSTLVDIIIMLIKLISLCVIATPRKRAGYVVIANNKY